MKINLTIIKIILNLLRKYSLFGCRIFAPFFLLFAITPFFAVSGTAVELRDELGWAGHGNFVGTAGSFRTSATQCGTTTSSTGQLHGIPAGATVAKAHLYWASSGEIADNTVSFSKGTLPAAVPATVTAPFDRQYSEVIQTYNYPYFSGAADVTTEVQSMIGVASGGSYSFTVSDLNVQQPPDLCEYLLMAGWSLIVIYEEASEPLRLVNVFEGFDEFWNESLTLTPKNFRVPANADLPGPGVNRGKHAHITWEGDENRSDVDENLIFEGQTLSFSSNPVNNQFNSTIADETLPAATWQTNVYGVDLDIYDITSLVSADAMQVTTLYKSGSDMVLLSAEVLSILNVNVADVAISQGVSTNPITSRASNADIRVAIDNNGPDATAGSLTATIVLPPELTLNETNTFTSDNAWVCTLTVEPSTIECSKPVNYANGAQDYFDIPVKVSATAPTNISFDVSIPGTVADPYPVVGGEFDNVTSNNSYTFDYTLLSGDISTSVKSYEDVNAGLALPGDQIKYTITLTETTGYSVTGVSIVDNIVSDLTNLNIITVPASAIDASTGTQVNISDINVPGNSSVVIEYTVDIVSTAVNGAVITNIATIDSNEFTAFDISSNFTVTRLTPLNTVKDLYLWGDGIAAPYSQDSTNAADLSRVAPSVAQGIFNIQQRPRNSVPCMQDLTANYCLVWTLDPSLVKTLNISAASVKLFIDHNRNGGGSNQNIQFGAALIDNSDNVLAEWNLDNSEGNHASVNRNTPTEVIMQMAVNINTVAAGDTIRLVIQNNRRNRDYDITPFTGSDTSQVLIDTTTVIAIDSIRFFDQAFTDNNGSDFGTAVTNIEPGQILYGRAIVSDPFGTFDISNVTVALTDPSGNGKLNQANLTGKTYPTVTDLDASQAMYEFTYTTLVTDEQGDWQAQITADEGSEGTIWDVNFGLISVIMPPELSVTKDVFLFSNPGTPITQAKIGDLLQYQILIENNSIGDAETVSVNDNISQYSAFIFNSNNSLDDSLSCLDCGAAGLTYVEPSYSANDGSSFTHPVVITQDGNNNNIDSNITNFKLDLTGTFIAGDSITFTYQVVVK